ncbi:MAG: hypothetical protein MR301_01020 [Prevotella sp.]|nr:hypothetical protein [Prevotella sp.]MDD7047129.1 hypothetical protein [Prevotella sp.]
MNGLNTDLNGVQAVFAFLGASGGVKKGVFGVWGDTWSDVWGDKEKRNVLLGVTFGVTVLTLKTSD